MIGFFPLAAPGNLLEHSRLKMDYVWIGFGSALGGMARYWLSGVIGERFGEAFPVGTLVVNATGSFVIGFLATLTDPEGRVHLSATARQFNKSSSRRPMPGRRIEPIREQTANG